METALLAKEKLRDYISHLLDKKGLFCVYVCGIN